MTQIRNIPTLSALVKKIFTFNIWGIWPGKLRYCMLKIIFFFSKSPINIFKSMWKYPLDDKEGMTKT